MTEVEIINGIQNNYYGLSKFTLDSDDAYEARCAEVFITLNRVLVFHCSICEDKYGSVDCFLEHLTTHYDEFKEENEIDTDCEKYDSETQEDDFRTELVQIEEEYLEELEDAEVESVVPFDDIYKENEEQESVGNHTDEEVAGFPVKKRKKSRIKATAEVFDCSECSRNFPTKRKLKQHSVIHSERRYACEICGFAFKERSNLNAHLRRHTGEKTISCSICSKKFFTTTEAATHMRSHTGERPYVCSHCGDAFKTSSKMTEHMKRHTELPPFKCNFCDKRLWRKNHFEDHLLVHTKEKPFVCPACGKRFPRNKALMRHMELH